MYKTVKHRYHPLVFLPIPNQPYRRDFHTRWTTLHPENSLTGQRIWDQERVIMKKSNTQENTQEVHGSCDMKYII